MATYRFILCDIWHDGKFVESMDLKQRILWIYLLTNKSVSQIGICTSTITQISNEVGIRKSEVIKILKVFEEEYEIIKFNDKTFEIGIKNFCKYNCRGAGKPMLDCIKKDLSKVSDISLIEYVMQSVNNEKVKALFLDEIDMRSNDRSTAGSQNEDIRDNKEDLRNKDLIDNNKIINIKSKTIGGVNIESSRENEKPTEEMLRLARDL